MACSRPDVSAVSAMACVVFKVQVVLQFEVCHGRSEVLLSGYGLNYQSEVVAEFGPKPGPRRIGASRWRAVAAMASPRTHRRGPTPSTRRYTQITWPRCRDSETLVLTLDRQLYRHHLLPYD